MAANNFASPLLARDAMEREINAIESEFKMCFPDDNVRILQILMSNTADQSHVFNRFVWGNLKSLHGANPDTLWDDLKNFYDTYYSAERIRLVVQVKTEDNLEELTKWIQESFSVIPNKSLGLQDFSQYTNSGKRESACTGKGPFEGVENRIVFVDSFQDLNKLFLMFSLPSDLKSAPKRSTHLILQLFDHRGQGSLFACLKDLNWVLEIETDPSDCLKTAFNMLSIEFELTEAGLLNYKKVLALIFAYIDRVRDEWLAAGEALPLFEEMKTISNLSYNVYTVPDQCENTCALSQAMIHCTKMDNIIRDVYEKTYIEEIDTEHVKSILSKMTYQNAIISLQGNDLLSQVETEKFTETPISEVQKEPHFTAKYRFFEKPANLKESFADAEFDEAMAKISKPDKNRFVPEDISTLVSTEDRMQRNLTPDMIQLTEDGKMHLFHSLDHVYLKPSTYLSIVLRIRQPKQRRNESKKPVSFL